VRSIAAAGLLQALAGPLAQVHRGLVVLDRREGDATVARELAASLARQRVDRRRHMRLPPDLIDRGRDGCRTVAVAQSARLDREHHGRRVAGLGRKALFEQVERLLRFGTGCGEVVRERPADRAREHASVTSTASTSRSERFQ
jgi:hypothetical protein